MTEPDHAEAEDDGRRYPSTIGGMFYLLVMAIMRRRFAPRPRASCEIGAPPSLVAIPQVARTPPRHRTV